MKNTLVVILILTSIQFAKAENPEIEVDLQKVCSANVQLLDKQYTQSPDSTLIPDVKRILKLMNQRNRLKSACKAVTRDRMPAQMQVSQGN